MLPVAWRRAAPRSRLDVLLFVAGRDEPTKGWMGPDYYYDPVAVIINFISYCLDRIC